MWIRARIGVGRKIVNKGERHDSTNEEEAGREQQQEESEQTDNNVFEQQKAEGLQHNSQSADGLGLQAQSLEPDQRRRRPDLRPSSSFSLSVRANWPDPPVCFLWV